MDSIGRRRVVIAVAVTAAVLIPGSVHGVPPSEDPAPPPSQWPASPAITARLEGAANAVRIWGPDRYQTSLASALALRGQGGFPFTTADRSSGGAGSLSGANGWWGVGECPRAIIVVAGDVAADALAASALSDPTGQSSEPYLQRTAAADPLFDPIGGFARVDTDAAPIVVTRSTRDGASALSPAARRAAQDLRSGGCTVARQAIVVGGPSAVPAGVDDELVSIGYDEVFRIQGATREATAAAVARSLGTAPVPTGITGCQDPIVTNGTARMAFYANSVIEHRSSATDCEVLGRTIVLADGATGADALAAGWWTSFWQVPVLLHNGGASLPQATADALATEDIDHLVVLGGTARISNAVVAQAVALTGASVRRVAGSDRYATSIEMARRFGGWYATGRGTEYEASLVCLAASSGQGDAARGWPDALTAGPWCGAANGAAANPGAPTRGIPPVTGRAPVTTADGPTRPAHDAVPILLIPFGADSLPAVTSTFLQQAFDPADNWCTSVAATPGCVYPGFAVLFGGGAALGAGVLSEVSRLVSGSSTLDAATIPPTLSDAFHTRLDLSPVFGISGSGPSRICAPRGEYQQARWVAVFGDADAARTLAAGDVMQSGRYVTDADSVERTPGIGAPVCVAHDPGSRTEVLARAVGLAGRASASHTFGIGADRRVSVLSALEATGPQSSSGLPSGSDPPTGGTTIVTFTTSAPNPAVTVQLGSQSTTVSSATITITLVRGTDTANTTAPDQFSASWSITTPLGTVTGTAAGEAILSAGTWQLAGVSTVTAGPGITGTARGGFRASWSTNDPGDPNDDAIAWRMDALADPSS